jgi:hypothetical protein
MSGYLSISFRHHISNKNRTYSFHYQPDAMRNLIFSLYFVLSILLIVLTARFFAYGAGNLFHLLLLAAVLAFSWGWFMEKNIA